MKKTIATLFLTAGLALAGIAGERGQEQIGRRVGQDEHEDRLAHATEDVRHR